MKGFARPRVRRAGVEMIDDMHRERGGLMAMRQTQRNRSETTRRRL